MEDGGHKRTTAGTGPSLCNVPYNAGDKWIAAAVSGILFLIFASPVFVRLLDPLAGKLGISLLGKRGSANILGLLVSAVFVVLATRLLLK